MGEKEAEIMQGHMMLLSDPMLTGEIENSIQNDKVNSEFAIENVCNMYADMFASMGDELMQQRATDMRDIKVRMQRTLMGLQSVDCLLYSSLGEKALLFSFRFNLTRERLEELWGLDEKLNRESSDRSLSFLLGYINSHIASEDDRKRFGLRYNREEILRDITLKRAVPSFEFREKDREGRIWWARICLLYTSISAMLILL